MQQVLPLLPLANLCYWATSADQCWQWLGIWDPALLQTIGIRYKILSDNCGPSCFQRLELKKWKYHICWSNFDQQHNRFLQLCCCCCCCCCFAHIWSRGVTGCYFSSWARSLPGGVTGWMSLPGGVLKLCAHVITVFGLWFLMMMSWQHGFSHHL